MIRPGSERQDGDDLRQEGAPQKPSALSQRSSLINQALWVLVVSLALVMLVRNFGTDALLKVGLVAIGLGLVIFIHELGHFAVAKWCDVHVETFSIGFGPPIPGCSFRRGDTLYKIAWFPLGGYVKMVGEGTEAEEEDDDPRSFKNKSVWQRMAIISAGVTMNVLLGFLCFIFVYMTHGAERAPAEVGVVDIGAPVWRHGMRSGAVIDRIGSTGPPDTPFFDDLKYEVSLSSHGAKLPLAYHLPDGKGAIETEIEPRRDKEDLSPLIGLAPPEEPKLMPKALRKTMHLPVLHDSAAARAMPAFEFGDAIVGTTDPEHPDQIKPLPIDPRDPDGKQLDVFEFENREQLLAGKPMIVQVRRAQAKPGDPPVNIEVPPSFYAVFPGLRMQIKRARKRGPLVKERVAD